MKLRHLLFGLLAGVAFVACTNDNEPAGVTPANGENEVAVAKYMAVNFVMPSADTRAIDDDGFKAAEQNENDVKKATFLFFKGESQIAAPYTINAGAADEAGVIWTPGTAAEKAPVIVMKNPTAVPDALVVLINYAGTVDQNKSLTDVKGIFDNYSATADGFVMSNSVYIDATGKQVIGAPVSAANVKDDIDEAKVAPVTVNVERVLAKVTVEDKTEETTVNGLTVELKGWGLVYENTKSYLIKNLKTSYDFGATWAKWNDVANQRSYWADSYTYTPATTTTGTSWADIAKNALGTTPKYTQENVPALPQKTISEGGTPTMVVVAAELQKNGEGVDLYKFGGIVYEKADLITLMANGYVGTYYKKDASGKLVNLDPATDYDLNAVTATDIEKYEAKVNLVLKATAVFDATGKDVTADAKAAIEGKLETVQYWQGGAAYYFVPIVQNSALEVNVKTPAKEATADSPAVQATYWGLFGVVRNHFYQLSINKVVGMGTAVPKTDQQIIPEIPEETDTYIAAKIKILDWKLVKQEVNLGE